MSSTRWKYGRYRKLYVREEGSFALLPLFARALAAQLLKACSDEGAIYVGDRRPAEALAFRFGANRRDRQLLRVYRPMLLEDGYVRLEGEFLLIRNFVDAQSQNKKRATGPQGAPQGDANDVHAGGPAATLANSGNQDRSGFSTSTNSTNSTTSTKRSSHVRTSGKPKSVPGESPDPPEAAYELADELRRLIADRLPGYKLISEARWPKTREQWANTFRLAHEQDKRSWDELRETLEWSQADEFWQANILSAATLRKQYDRLRAQMARPTSPRSAANDIRFGYAPPSDASDFAVEGDLW